MSGHIKLARAADIRPSTFDAKAGTVSVIWTTGAAVRRFDLFTGEAYDEVLSLAPGAVRLERLNSGAAPFLNSHSGDKLSDVLGSIVPGSASISDGRGIATVKLSNAPCDADIVEKIAAGVIRSVSCGYWVHQSEESDMGSGIPTRTAIDWEPLEISAVPIPADPGSMIRSAPTGTHRPRRGDHVHIRRMAARAGRVEMGEAAIRAGQSDDQFFNDLASQLVADNRARRRALDAPALDAEPRPPKRKQDAPMYTLQYDRDFAAGAAMAKRVLGDTTMRAAAAAFAAERGRPGSTASDAAADFAAGARMAQAALRR